jgi:pilus assembly protein Flp/PilA
MRILSTALTRLCRDRKAATAVEYGLIVSLVVIAMVAALMSVGRTTADMWNNVSDKVQNPGN